MLSSSTIKQQAIPPFHNHTEFSSHLRIITEVDKLSNTTKWYLYSMLSKNKIVITPDVPKAVSEFREEHMDVGMVFAVVGTSWCGKSTIANVARQLFGPKYGRNEKGVFCDLIRGSIVKTFSQLLNCLRNFLDQEDFVKEHHRAIYDRLVDFKIYKLKKSLKSPNFTSSGCEPRGLHSEYEAQKSTIISTPIGKEEFEQLKRELIQYFAERNDLIDRSFDIHTELANVVKVLDRLWNDPIVQIIYSLNHRIPNLNVLTNLEYWVARLKKVFAPGYSPKSKDILQCHPAHNGIYANHPMTCKFPKSQTETVTEIPLFEPKEIPFVVLDVTDITRKLEHVIDLVTDIIFVVSMDDYYLTDDRNTDRLSDAIQKFRKLCEDMKESFLTRRIPLKNITLVFNKFDMFTQMASKSQDPFIKLETTHPDIYTYYGTDSGSSQQLIRSLIDYFVNIYDSYFREIREFPISKNQIETYRLTSSLLAGTILNICVTSATDKTNMQDFWRFVIGREKGVEQRSYCTDGSWIPFRMCRSTLHEQYGISYLNWGENFFIHGNNQPFRFAVHVSLLLLRCPELAKRIEATEKNMKAVNIYEPVPTIMVDYDVGALAELIRRIYDGFSVSSLHEFITHYPSLLPVVIKKPKIITNKPKLLRPLIQKYKQIKAKTIHKKIIFRFNHPQLSDIADYVDLIGSNISTTLSGAHDMILYHQAGNISGCKFMLSMRLPGFTLEKDYYVLVPYIKKSSYYNVLRILSHERDVSTNDWKEMIEMIFISKMWQFEDDSILVETLRKMFKNVISVNNVNQMSELLSKDYIDFSQLDDPVQNMISARTLLDDLPTEIIYSISSFLYGVFDTNPQNSLIDQDYLSLICCLSHTSFFSFFSKIPKDKFKQFIWKTKFTKFTLFEKECSSFQEKHK